MTSTFMYLSYLSVGMLFLFYLPLCFFILWLLRKLLKFGNYSLLFVSIIMFLLPTWDAILGKYYLDKLCEADGGNYILVNKRVEGLHLKQIPSAYIAKIYLNKGYSYIEMGNEKGYTRFSYDENNEVESKPIKSYTALETIGHETKYQVGPSYLDIRLSDKYIINKNSNEKLGGFRRYILSTRISKKIAAIGGNRQAYCGDVSKLKKQERFSTERNFEYSLANFNKNTGNE